MSDQPAMNQQEEILEDILPEFLVEADDLLESLNELLLQLDEGVKAQCDQDVPECDKELLNEVFRSAHTLKGLSGMFGFTDINQLTHKVENIFDAARSDQLPMTEHIVDVIFRGIDHVSAMVEALRNGEANVVDAEAIQAEIQTVLEETGTVKELAGEVDLEAAMAAAQAEQANTTTAVDDVDLEAALVQAAAERAQAQTTAEPIPEESTLADPEVESDELVSNKQAAETEPEFTAEQSVEADTTEAKVASEESTASEDAEEPTIEEVAAQEELEPTAEESAPESFDDTESDDLFADVVDDDNIPANYLSIFVDETETSLDSLTELLLDNVDEKIAEHLLVICHRIKGSAASIGLNRAAALGHVMEDLLQDLEEEQQQPTVEMADALLCCIDALRGHVGELTQGIHNVFEFQEPYHQLLAAREKARHGAAENNDVTETTEQPSRPSSTTAQPIAEVPVAETSTNATDEAQQNTESQQLAATTEEKTVAKKPTQDEQASEKPSQNETPTTGQFDAEKLAKVVATAPTGSQALAVQIEFRPNLMLVGLKARLLYEKLAHFGDVFFCEPSEKELDDLDELSVMVMGVATTEANEKIQTSLSVEGVQQLHIESLKAKTSDAEMPVNQQAEAKVEPPKPVVIETVKKPETKAPKPVAAKPAATKEAASAKQPAVAANAKSPATTADAASKPAETVRVDIDRLDQLMNMAGQLVINKARFSQINASIKRSIGSKSSANTINDLKRSVEQLRHGFDNCTDQRSFDDNYESMQSCLRRVFANMESLQHQLEQLDEARLTVNDLSEAVHQLDRVADGIQKGVMDTRMVPIGPLFGRFKRVVRDISHSSGKKIRLEIRGENTELDKRMIDELGDPLIHIVRNSADHGIESPADREAVGKPAEGTVILDASHRGNSIVIEIIDDGKGLDTERIRKKAIEKGVVTEADIEKMSEYQIHQLIWEPGFSTAEQVTNVSGRGMGMDIVRSKIEDINGVVEMHSTAGEGTRIAIKLPLTLAILPSLLADIEGDVFAIPVESVSEIVSLKPEDLSTVHSMPTATVRGKTISVVYLSSLFQWSHPAKKEAFAQEPEETILVIVESEGEQLGLVVDSLLGEEDIVIKSLAENYQNVDGIAGASILGDGRVSLILDTSAMLVAASGQAELQCAV